MGDWTSEYMTMIEDCENRSDRLTDWEADFVDSIKNQLIEGRSLSSKQTEVLDRIWERVTTRR